MEDMMVLLIATSNLCSHAAPVTGCYYCLLDWRRAKIRVSSGAFPVDPLSSSPVRIPGFHPGDPGSNPGNVRFFAVHY